MAIAVFTDIHGNLEALEAILKDIHKSGSRFHRFLPLVSRYKKRDKIDKIYFLGDAVTFGPDSSKCLKLLQKHNVLCVVGNHEQRLIRYDKSVSEMTFGGVKHMEYIFHSLDNDDIRFIKSMPLSRVLTYKGFKLYFAHYSHDEKGLVHEDLDCFREDMLDKMFEKSDCDAVFFGHQHERKLYIRPNQRSYFSLDSSGLTKGDITNYTYFDIGATANDNYDIYRIDVKYNRKKFVQKMIEHPIPEKVFFAKKFFDIDIEDKTEANLKGDNE